jgi:putative spermidine/putrescine transport system ATP-binding protein
MWKGAVEQIGTPEEIYDRPVSAFVADFVGFENCFAVERGGLKTGDGVVALAGAIPDGAAGLAWRPEAVALGVGPFQGVVRGASFAGATRQYLLDAPPLGPIKAEAPATLPPHAIGTTLKFDLPLDKAARLTRF